MTGLSRRSILAGLSASLLPFSAHAQASDAKLREALDGLGELPDYSARLAQLAGFDPSHLSPSASLDLRTLRNNIAIDSQLARFMPGGRSEGPYRLPPPASTGLWRHPNGAAVYRLLLERHVGAHIDPEAAHRRFEHEADLLGRRARRLMAAYTDSRGSVGAGFRAMFAEPAWLYADDDAGRDRAVTDMNGWLDPARKWLPELVGPVPRASLDVRVRRTSRADEAAGKGGYREIPAPGQPGGYFVDLKDIRRRPMWTLGSVVHHELLPGHMVQLPIEAEAGAHPLRIAYLSAFSEGWAIHAEQLMARRGAYRDLPLDELGHIHWLLFRAVRGLIDTGIHHRRWSLDQARAEFDRRQGVAAYFAPFERDLERIVAEPAVRAAEALVWLGLADRTRGLAGAALRRANQAILAHGRKPLRFIPNGGSRV